MAITKIQTGGIPALAVTHDKLHTDMDLSTKTVTLPSAITDTITNKLPLAGGTVTGNIQLNNAVELRTLDTGGSARTIVRANSSNELEFGWSAVGPVKFMGGSSYTERMRIHTNGNVGIGTANPVENLDIYQGASSGGIRLHSTTADSYVKFENDDNSWFLSHDGNDNSGSNNSLQISENGTNTRFMVAVGGNVGIGTTSPDYTLDVSHGTTAEYVATFQNTADNLELKIGTMTGGLLNIQGVTVNNNTAYNIALQAEGGNVGIGIASPSEKLHVEGDVRLADAASIQFGSSKYQTLTGQAGSNDLLYRTYANHIFKTTTGPSNNTDGTERMKIDASGRVTMPYQPSFLATRSADLQVNASGGIAMQCDVIEHNIGGHYSTSTFLFTAPIAGSYQFNAIARFNAVGSGYHLVRFYKNGAAFPGAYSISQDTGSYNTVVLAITAELQANDTFNPHMLTSGDASWQMDNNISFSGYLIG